MRRCRFCRVVLLLAGACSVALVQGLDAATRVSTVADLRKAMLSGQPHIVLTDHLDFRPEDDHLRLTGTLQSIQVRGHSPQYMHCTCTARSSALLRQPFLALLVDIAQQMLIFIAVFAWLHIGPASHTCLHPCV
jgi:hypothetical protein